MARVSISKAAKLAGVSRATLYKTYINKGRISVSSDPDGKKYIDTSEILRVFGSIKPEKADSLARQVDSKADTVEPDGDTLAIQVEMLEKQLNEALKREELLRQDFGGRESFYQSQIKELTSTIKLLEPPEKHPRLWWQFWK